MIKSTFFIIMTAVCASAQEPESSETDVMLTKSPLMVSREPSGLLGTFSDANETGTGIVVDPSHAGTKTFVTFKSLPDSKLSELGFEDMEMVSGETTPEDEGRSTQTRIYASPADKNSTRVFLKYRVTTQSELTVKGIPHRSAQIHYYASIYRIKGEFDVTYHKTFHASINQ